MQRYHQDLTGFSPLATRISFKRGQDYWLCIRNLTDIIREQYSLTFKDGCFKTFPWVLFQQLQEGDTRVRLHLLKDFLTSQASPAGALQTAVPQHSAMLYDCFPAPA